MHGDQRDTGIVVGVAGHVIDSRADQIGGPLNAEELRRAGVHLVVKPYPVQRRSGRAVGVVVDPRFHVCPGQSAQAGVNLAEEDRCARCARPDVAQWQLLSTEQAQCFVGREVYIDASGRVGALVAIVDGVGDDLVGAHPRVVGGHEVEERGDVGWFGAEQQVPQPEQVVSQEAVGGAGWLGGDAHLHVGVQVFRSDAIAAVGAEASAQAVPVVAAAEGEFLGLASEGRRLDHEGAVQRVGVGHHRPQAQP